MVGPLSGKRILLTRPEGQGAVTARILLARGAYPIEMPLISIVPPPDSARVAEAMRRLMDYDVIAFTSENAVTLFFKEFHAQVGNASLFERTRVAAIGSGTASALHLEGVRVDIVPGAFVGEALAQAILDDPSIQGQLPHHCPRVIILRALVAREVVPQRLRDAGCDVDVVPVYETRPVSANRRDELISRFEAQAIDVVMLTSSSAANRLVDLLGSQAVELMKSVVVASIGPITTATAKQRGLTVKLTAMENTLAGLISALESHYAKGTSTSSR